MGHKIKEEVKQERKRSTLTLLRRIGLLIDNFCGTGGTNTRSLSGKEIDADLNDPTIGEKAFFNKHSTFDTEVKKDWEPPN